MDLNNNGNIVSDNSFNYINDSVDPGILNRNLMQGLGWILGFRKGEYKIEEQTDTNITDISYGKVVNIRRNL